MLEWNVRSGCVWLVLALASGCDDESAGKLGDARVEVAHPGRRADDVGRGWFQVAGVWHELEYLVVDGDVVLDGDVLLGRADELTALQRGERDPPRAALWPAAAWPDAVVPYAFASDLPHEERADARAAMDHYHAHTSVRFVEHQGQPDWLVVRPGSGCAADIGRRGGPQSLYLAPGCDVGEAIHELAHTLGVWHEQSRADRDAHVVIHWDNIEHGVETNFATYVQLGAGGVDVGGYDDASIMHYPSWAFSRNGLPTITRADGSVIEGQRDGLSAGDIAGIAALYGSGGSGPSDEGDACYDTWAACSDPADCACVGCVDDGVCAEDDDCTCADCHADSFCGADTNCMDDGVCDVYYEGCICADCSETEVCDGYGEEDTSACYEGWDACLDPAACACLGCVDDGVCTFDDDCTCRDCDADGYCADVTNCLDDGWCDVYYEGCGCADCGELAVCG